MIYSEYKEIPNEEIMTSNVAIEQIEEQIFRSQINIILQKMSLEQIKQVFGCYKHDKPWATKILQEAAPFRKSELAARRILEGNVTLFETIIRLKDDDKE